MLKFLLGADGWVQCDRACFVAVFMFVHSRGVVQVVGDDNGREVFVTERV